MNWNIRNDAPVYTQLVDQIARAIILGQFPPGSKLPSEAQLSEAHGVSRSRMVLKGHSYNDPVASNATPQGRFANQRVEINSTIQVEKTVN